MSNRRTFFYYVIPSVLSFALSGIYAIVDGFFVGNSIGDAGLSTCCRNGFFPRWGHTASCWSWEKSTQR